MKDKHITGLLFWLPFIIAFLLIVYALYVLADHADASSIPSSIIVQFAATSAQKAQAGWRPIYGMPGRYAIPVEAGKMGSVLNTYSARPDVTLTEPNWTVTLDPTERSAAPGLIRASVNDPLASQQYSLAKMNVYSAWDVSKGNGVVVAVVDTGVDMTHQELAGKLDSRGRDFVNGDDNATDDNGHGTHVSGIVGAATNNGVGVSGVGYNVRILPVKVLNASGSGDHGTIASGILWAADQGAKVINLSLGGVQGSQTLEDAVNTATARGALVVAAAGNGNSASPSYPAAYPNVLSVCATDASDNKASFSNYGPTVDVCAPGQSILSTVRGGQYEAWNGTSMAAPNASGVAALVRSAHPDWTVAQVKAVLENTTDSVSVNVSHGRLNAAKAVGVSVINPTPTPPSAPNGDWAVRVVELINQSRAQYSLGPFQIDSRLEDAADFHNRYMTDNGCFAHICNGEPDPFTRIRNAGYAYTTASEVIGAGYQTPQDVVNGWLNSEGHRAIILGGQHDIGCGYLYSSHAQYGFYWTCDTAIPNGVVVPPTRTRPADTPVPQPTVPTPSPITTPTLPANWVMSIHLPYNRFAWSQIHQLYLDLCLGLRGQGAWCTWERMP